MKRQKAKRVRKQTGPIKAFQALPEDIRLMGELKLKLEGEQGRVSDSTLFRMGLRALAEAKGINLVQP